MARSACRSLCDTLRVPIGFRNVRNTARCADADVRLWDVPSFRDLSEMVADLSCRDLPFTWYAMGPVGNAVEFDVATRDCPIASAYFVEHPQALADGTPVPVVVRPRRGDSWVSPPSTEVAETSNVLDHASLVGRDVDEAAQQANAAGWLVRALEPEAVVTADYNPGRLNLCYGDNRVVESVHQG